jgi:hypothetical protein
MDLSQMHHNPYIAQPHHMLGPMATNTKQHGIGILDEHSKIAQQDEGVDLGKDMLLA